MELEEAKKYIIMILRQKDVPDAVKSQECIYAVEAIETVLQELEQKEKRIYYLENMAKADITHEIDKHKFEIYKNYIPKGKIEDKIEELVKKLNEPNCDRWEKDDGIYYDKLKVQIRLLQELLEE